MTNINEMFGGMVGPHEYKPYDPKDDTYVPAPQGRMPIQMIPKRPVFDTPIDPWQQKLTTMVKSRKNNIIVNVSPSGGKTSPILRAWVELLKEATVSKKPLPKLLFIGKTRQLALQLFMDVRKIIEKLVIELAKAKTEILSSAEINLRKDQLNELVVVKTGGSGTSTVFGEGKLTSNTIAMIATMPKVKELIKAHKFRLIIIDELQEYLNKPGSEIFEGKDDIKSMIDLVRMGDRPDNTIVMLTGSLNATTTRKLAWWLSLIAKKKFIPIFEAVANRSLIKVVPNRQMQKPNDLIKIVENVINHKQKNSLLILFSVGDPSRIETRARKNIISISNSLLKSIPAKDITSITGQKIHRTTDRQRERDEVYGKTAAGAIPKFARSDADELSDMVRGYSISDRGERIPRDKFLGQCLLRGFGYIAGGKVRIKHMGFSPENRDTLLVQKLFKDGRINLLIATNAVGVGANLKVRHLYIPSLMKFSGLQMEPIDESSLVQLLHRAGRDPKESATIYCDQDDIGLISTWIDKTDTYEAIPQVSIRNVTPSILRNLGKQFLSKTNQYFHSQRGGSI